mmetsp:Transcript_12460/g.30550  ORF Transcript_12460/g.30550 Transcript_12460/m.30550 type:complete len:547 (-) Transcript_12460:765-2405(-)
MSTVNQPLLECLKARILGRLRLLLGERSLLVPFWQVRSEIIVFESRICVFFLGLVRLKLLLVLELDVQALDELRVLFIVLPRLQDFGGLALCVSKVRDGRLLLGYQLQVFVSLLRELHGLRKGINNVLAHREVVTTDRLFCRVRSCRRCDPVGTIVENEVNLGRAESCVKRELAEVLVCRNIWLPIELLRHLLRMLNLLLHSRRICVWLNGLKGYAAVIETLLVTNEGLDHFVQRRWLGRSPIPREVFDPLHHTIERGFVVECEFPPVGLLHKLHQCIWPPGIKALLNQRLGLPDFNLYPHLEIPLSLFQLVLPIRKHLLYFDCIRSGQIPKEGEALNHSVFTAVLCEKLCATLAVVLGLLHLVIFFCVPGEEHGPIDAKALNPAGRQIQNMIRLSDLLCSLNRHGIFHEHPPRTRLLHLWLCPKTPIFVVVASRRGKGALHEHKFPTLEVVQCEAHFLHRNSLHVHPVVLVVENPLDTQVGGRVGLKHLARACFHEHVLVHFPLSRTHKHPAVDAQPVERVLLDCIFLCSEFLLGHKLLPTQLLV